ncbi:MAG TPA: helix-turn-helix transcriptional regulator, partial [Streptosporangiaceae bacterium]
VLAYALQQPPERPAKEPPKRAVSDGAPLTPRELQVARLVAGGRSNKDIAAELVISQRTAEGHVERILTKLGFTSRAQVAAWVVASQPDGEGRLAALGVQAPIVQPAPRQQVVLRVFATSLTRHASSQTGQVIDDAHRLDGALCWQPRLEHQKRGGGRTGQAKTRPGPPGRPPTWWRSRPGRTCQRGRSRASPAATLTVGAGELQP